MFVQAFPSGPFLTNAYVAACVEKRQAAIIDPAPGSFGSIASFLEEKGWKAQNILLTHSHWDHIADIARFKEKWSLPVYVHRLDAPNLLNPGADGLPFWVPIGVVQPNVWLEESMQVSIGQLTFSVLHTPGHSPGSICLYEPQQHVLFSGDTLFQGSIGNLSFPTSQPSLMWASLARLAQLPPKTRVFPGHGAATTLEEEAAWLPFAKKLFDE